MGGRIAVGSTASAVAEPIIGWEGLSLVPVRVFQGSLVTGAPGNDVMEDGAA
ncbi:hypothetical protein [Cryobacterium sp. M15]|jgi:hypothetical protein|uniref:hypothetical protein n=1 Tax=Cryobacterium sp. M15 TaxID=2048291 RepID=UPI001305013B|nr:hypothetical protein [Cryobacterium sp. M15]